MSRRHKCKITGERTKRTNRHHLYPRPYHKGHRNDWIYIRMDLHDYLHEVYTNRHLAGVLNTPEDIREQLEEDGMI